MGVGMVFLSLVFGLIYNLDSKKDKTIVNEPALSEQEIMDKAKELGMINYADLPKRSLTDEDIIERASELGMVFKEDLDEEEALASGD